MSETIPLFPLHTVLFPGGVLRLRIFEPRYLEMVSRCAREAGEFGIALIVEGQEAGGPARTVAVGTSARIVDFEQLEDGLLGITVRGARRFRIRSTGRQSDGLQVGEVEWLAEEPAVTVPERYAILSQLLRQALSQVGMSYEEALIAEASWVGMRLAEMLPLPPAQRQELLEMTDSVARLKWLHGHLDIRTG
ncbi:MAG TPA: LON peptidase substrate-binding domain-containing protein [Steroidobacteraceae bacterium]